MSKKIIFFSTGGTLEKTYDSIAGVLCNNRIVLDIILGQLKLNVVLERQVLMNKDSLLMTQADHNLLVNKIIESLESHEYDGIVISHGTDHLSVSGELLYTKLKKTSSNYCPIVFTGAMIPYMMRDTDALQNVTEALIAVQILPPGVYVTLHNKILKFPGVIKDKKFGIFRKNG